MNNIGLLLKQRLREQYQKTLKIRVSFEKFKKLSASRPQRFKLDWSDRLPCPHENTPGLTGFDAHYVYHTAWAARVLANLRPKQHVDVSSYLYFSTIVSAFIPTQYLEFRPPTLSLPGLTVESGDLNALPFESGSIESISCMHVIEHIGLGRYGDPLDPDGDLKAIQELKRVTAEGGSVLFVVPIGKPMIQFNAHRIYSYQQVIDQFQGFELKEFALIPDGVNGGLLVGASQAMADEQRYGCGCFWFCKSSMLG